MPDAIITINGMQYRVYGHKSSGRYSIYEYYHVAYGWRTLRNLNSRALVSYKLGGPPVDSFEHASRQATVTATPLQQINDEMRTL